MLHDARSAGSRMPSAVTPTPATKKQTRNSDPRRQRKTVSIDHPSADAPQRDALESARLSGPSTMDFSRQRHRNELHQTERASPTTKSEQFFEGKRDFLTKSKSSNRLRSGATERKLTLSGNPRDTGKAGALTFAGTTTSTAPSTSVGTVHPPVPHPASSSYPSSLSHLHHSPALPDLPRLPQSRFSFEYRSPLRKIALTSHLKSASVDLSTSALESTASPKVPALYDRHRRSVPNFHLSHVESQAAPDPSQIPPSSSTTTQGGDSALSPAAGSTVRVLSPNELERRKSALYFQQEPPDVKRAMPSSTATFVQGRTYTNENGDPVNVSERYSHQDGFRTSIANDSRTKSEDIFLNIARSDTSRRESFGRSDLRRSRLRMSGNGFRSSTSRVSSDLTPSPDQLPRSNTFESPLHPNSQNTSPSTRYSSLPHMYSASAHPLDEQGRSPQSNFTSSSRSTIGLPRSRLSRASPENETGVERRSSVHDSRSFRHSTLSTIRSSRQASGSEATDKPRYDLERSQKDGTESTLSTTAPSTVWDELEDLKSRIKKLELTGRLPPSSQEAITSVSGDRPRTATTTVTTMSSSPRHRRTSISGESDTITVPSPVHPLLQSALVKARNSVSKEVYTALEATATDAMALSQLLGTGKTPSGSVSVANGYYPAERQSRRKADSVCRSLTELCLALSDEHHTKHQSPSGDATFRMSQSNGTDEGTITPTMSYRRSISQEPEEATRRQSGPRTTSRLEARRASLANQSDHPSPETSGQNPKLNHSPGSPATGSRLSRLSVSVRTRRLQDEEASEPRSPHSRSISRSMTDIGAASSSQGPSQRQRGSFGYPAPPAADEPPQSSQPRTPTASQSGIPLRRNLMTPSSYTPAIPRANIQAGSRRYGLTPAATEGPQDDVPLSPRQQTPQTKIVAPSSKLASSYTPISQSRFRTNSLGGRRLGIARPPMSTVDDGKSKSFNDSID
ncbi:putative LPXTG-motif cell wall anchor domain protein [Aspergillus lucknowensis]|uniref:LPXTG-motif cell wall anchor domain protein n=1 Tax=Aspergillus lucknowensis TaxID=176173 RepID=A0ABR4LVU9_9EURO